MEETLDTQHRQAATRLTSGEDDSVKVLVDGDGTVDERELTVHPFARLIPLIALGDLDRLYDDIKEHGVNEPLVMFEDMVLDGRNRLAVAATLGVPVQLKNFNGTEADARAFVWSANAARRHLTIPQIALAADRFGFIKAAKAEAGPRIPDADGSMPPGAAPWANLAAKRLGRQITPRTLERFDEARISEAPDTMRKIETGEIRRVDVAVKEAAAERTILTGKMVNIPPVVPRTPWDRLGCARGDVLAAERAILAGDRGVMTRKQFADRAREIQAALIRIEWLYRENRVGNGY
jgi:hypothetical protein